MVFSWGLVIFGIASLALLISLACLASEVGRVAGKKGLLPVVVLAALGIFVPVVLGVAAAAIAIDWLSRNRPGEPGPEPEIGRFGPVA